MKKKIFMLISAFLLVITIQFSNGQTQHEDAISVDEPSMKIMNFSDPYIDGMG
ncbi:hypothetical protein [Pontibacillus salipaludis]|uniref:Uncharacterized protein n=1 Tax=Pontibacillus salipaludis TaxID=1697394 RepID=A0ABQ1QA60_9BACI|nr:hypothetical protein [Pontibacillus salipaludis]GGD19770.1 hypothetical protein GCM10011389_29290 [Pontibacillus salipaludis]